MWEIEATRSSSWRALEFSEEKRQGASRLSADSIGVFSSLFLHPLFSVVNTDDLPPAWAGAYRAPYVLGKHPRHHMPIPERTTISRGGK